jgi:hypothetical protein
MHKNAITRATAAALVVAFAGFWSAALSGEGEPPQSGIIDASKHSSLQAAIDAVGATGGLVQLPGGEFRLAEPLVISRGDIRIVGAGAATRLVNVNRAGKPAIHIRPADRATERRARIWRVQLANFRIIGDTSAVDAKTSDPKPKSGDGVRAEGVNEIYIHGLSVDHCGGNGIHLIDCYEDPRISDSILTYNAEAGLHIRAGHDIVVSANQFEENQDALRCIDSFNLCMNANNIDDHLRHGIVVENTYGSVLSGNMIEECTGTAIVLDRDVYGVTIGSNVIAHNQGGGVDVRDAWGSSISANTFTIMPNPAVRVGPNSGRIAITGNAFSNSHIGPETRRQEDYEAKWPRKVYASGIELEGTTDIVISGNLFAGLIEEAVRTKGRCLRIALSGNVASDLGRKRGEKLPAFNMSGAQEISAGLNATEKGFEGGLR